MRSLKKKIIEFKNVNGLTNKKNGISLYCHDDVLLLKKKQTKNKHENEEQGRTRNKYPF